MLMWKDHISPGSKEPESDFLRLPLGRFREVPLLPGNNKRISLAPELPGALEFGQRMREVGIMVAIGHSDATYEEVLSAIENGFLM